MRLLVPSALAAGFASLYAQAVQPPQTFRAGVDLVQVDVSVLDKQRKPVRGLVQQDFSLFEDGKPRPVVAFMAVDLPGRADPASPAWAREVATDVATNAAPEEGRLVVILMDRTIPDGWPTINARNIAKAAVRELGPGDLAAVVYTGSGGLPHDFTSDRARLIAAIDRAYPAGELSDEANAVWEGLTADFVATTGRDLPTGAGALNVSTECLCGTCVLGAIGRVADAVRDVGPRRKSLLFIGRDLQIETTEFICYPHVKKAREIMFRSLDLASLTVHALDPGGLETLSPAASLRAPGYRGRANLVRQGNISVLPDRTGGRTVLNTNNPMMRVPEIFAESDSYYLLGFEPAVKDGQRHNISVKVNRRGVDVRTRRGYVAGSSSAGSAVAEDAASAPAEAINGLMPVRNGVSMSAQVLALPAPDTRGSVLAVALHVRHDAGLVPAPAAEQVEIVTAVFRVTGQVVGTLRQTLSVTPQTGGGAASYDVLQRIPAKPGRYELRIGLTNASRRQTGSVYAFVDIPDFRRAPFAMTDIALYAPAGPPAMKDELSDLLPAPPTARRDLDRQERATAFVRFYRAAGAPPATVFISTRIVDSGNRKRYGQDASMTSSAFGPTHTADHVVDLPLNDLESGSYLLTIEAKAGAVSQRRDLRFTVR